MYFQMNVNVDNTSVMDTSKCEGKRLLRTLELKAFRSVVDAFRSQGSFTNHKCKVLKSLASTLKVGDERCRSEMRRAVNDNLLNYIAQCSEEPSEEKWRLESARKVARVPMINELTIFTALADKVSDWVVSHNQTFVNNKCTLTEILESKKGQKEVNASRYHTTKLLGPLLPTSLRRYENITTELEKIKSHLKESIDEIHISERKCSSISKLTEVTSPVEKRQITNTVVDNTHIKVHKDDESNHKDMIVNKFPSTDVVPEVKTNVPRKSRPVNKFPSTDVVPEVKADVQNKSRPTKGRTKSCRKRSQLSKTSSLQEELSRAVTAVNALVMSSTEERDEQSPLGKRPSGDCITAVTDDDCQPKEKKLKHNIKKVSTAHIDKKKLSIISSEEKKSLIVSLEEKKSTDVQNSAEKSSISNNFPVNDLRIDNIQEPSYQSHKSTVSVPLEKDFTPHTFNLIPASRRLKMIKKKENSVGSLSVKEQNHRKINASSLTIIESTLSKRGNAVAQNSASNVPQVNNSSSVETICSVQVTSLQNEQEKDIDQLSKNLLPMLSQTKKTLSLLGNIKVRNLNAKMEEESLENFISNYDKTEDKMEGENEDDDRESEVSQSEIDLSTAFDLSDYSTLDEESDSASVIEYWDHDGDEDIFDDESNTVECDKDGSQKVYTSHSKEVTEDDTLQIHQAMLTDQIDPDSEFSDEVVEEIIEDEEFSFSDDTDCESSVAKKLVLANTVSVNLSQGNEEENVKKFGQTVSAEKPTIQKSESNVTAYNASVIQPIHSSSTSIENSYTCKVLKSSKSNVKIENLPTTKAGSLASGTAVSILKLRKPFVVGTAESLAKEKEVILVSPKLQKPITANVKSEKSESVSSKCQMIAPSKCIVGDHTISLTNACLINAAPKTSPSTLITSQASIAELPKITLYSSPKIPNSSSGLRIPTSVSKRFILSPSTKSTSTNNPSVKHAPSFKHSTLPISKKVCRLYDLMDVSEPMYSNSSSIDCVKKNVSNKKSVVNISSS